MRINQRCFTKDSSRWTNARILHIEGTTIKLCTDCFNIRDMDVIDFNRKYTLANDDVRLEDGTILEYPTDVEDFIQDVEINISVVKEWIHWNRGVYE